MDRRALDALLAMPERNRFLRGMTVWVGFTQTAVPFVRERAQRRARRSTRSRKMLRFSFDAITSFSHAPLQLATFLGFVCSALAFLGDPAGDRRPLHEHLRARRPVDDRRSCCCWAASS